ncbi:MAG: M14 family metallopeptidase, partial [bacterium]|nr:M14 family metallopeptidase [bacterium]
AVLSGGVFALVALQRQASEIPPLAEEKNRGSQHELIGKSLEGRGIEAYTYGDGEEHLVFVGGIHGGYEWNSVLLAYQFMEYLEENQSVVPDNLTVTVIPSANPDGVYSVVGKEGRFTIMDVPTDTEVLRAGRFNARGVDLNRNFDCEWKPTSMWRSKQVSAGSAPFSEPEAMAIRNFILENDPDAVIFWHSQANAVYASECGAGILPETLDMMNAYSRASGYPAAESFDQYEITGAAEGWLASIGIPTLTVELQTHETIEWERNLAGIKALLGYYSQKTGIGR